MGRNKKFGELTFFHLKTNYKVTIMLSGISAYWASTSPIPNTKIKNSRWISGQRGNTHIERTHFQ